MARSITDTLKTNLVKSLTLREQRAVNDARMLADHSDQVSQALRQIDPKLETAVLALAEFVEFQRAIRADIQAIAGHAAEDNDLARTHADDLAQVATVAINLPEVVEAQHIGLEEIQAGASDGEVEQVIYRLAYRVRQAYRAGDHRALRIGLVFDHAD